MLTICVVSLCEVTFCQISSAFFLTEIIKCEVSCFKFDGYASDGKRILMRDCGYFDTDECVSGQNFEDGTAVGTICHCKENRCNGAANAMSSVFLVATAMIVVLKQLMYS